MNIRISRKTLSDALNEVGAIAGKNRILSICDNVKFVTKGNRIRLQTTDAENTLRKYIEAVDIDENGEFLVNCKSLQSYAKALSDDEIYLEVKEGQVTVKHAHGKAKLPTANVEDFPELNLSEKQNTFTVPSYALIDAIDNGIKFASNQEFQKVLQNIYCYVEDGKFGYCGTDTKRLLADETPIEGLDFSTSWLIHYSTAPLILKSCANAEQVEIEDYETLTCYKMGDTMLYTAKVHGQYPSFKRIIPRQNHIVCETNRVDFINALRRAVAVSSPLNKLVRLTITADNINIRIDDLENGKIAIEDVEAKCNDQITLGCDFLYLLDCANASKDETLRMTFKDANCPLTVTDDERPMKTIMLATLKINQTI